MIQRTFLLAAFLVIVGCGSDEQQSDNIETVDLTPATTDVPSPQTILGALEANGLTSFLDAVESTGLDQTLGGEGPFTVLAPLDEVIEFGSFNAEDHILQGRFETIFLAGTMEIEAISGNTIAFIEDAGNTTLRGNGQSANMVQTDIQMDNGVIHIIDHVLSPQP